MSGYHTGEPDGGDRSGGQGKRGPNGGAIDIDDPHEVIATDPLAVGVHKAFVQVLAAADAERRGIRPNREIHLARAIDALAGAIRGEVQKQVRPDA